jgi:hypothetical protein
MRARYLIEDLNDEPIYNGEDENEIDVMDDDMIEFDDSVDIEEDEIEVKDDIETIMDNELKIPEYARKPINVDLKGLGYCDIIPMAKMKDNSFVVKINEKFRKIKIEDIVKN